MTKTPTPASHAVNAAPISADLRGIKQEAAPQHVATVWVDDDGCNDFELSPFFSLPAGEHKLYTGAAPASPAQQDAPVLATDLREHLRWAIRRIRRLDHEKSDASCGARFSGAVAALERADAVSAWGSSTAAPAQAQQDAPAAQPSRECLQQSAEHAAALRSAIAPLINAYGEAQWQSGRGVPHPDLEQAFEAIIAAALQAAPPAPAGVAVPASQDQYLCQAWGETGLPAVAIVDGLDGVRAFLIEQWLGDEDASHDDGTKALPAAMQEMQDEWAEEGEAWKWETAFEIGGVSVQKVGRASLAAAPAQAVAVPDDAVRNAIKELREKADECLSQAGGSLGVFAGLGGAAALRDLANCFERATAASPAQAVAVPDEHAAFEAWAPGHYADIDLEREADGYRHSLAQEWWEAWQARAALAAAPAQAVAVPGEVDLPDVEDMAHSAVQEALSYGVSHDVFHRWMRAVMDKTVQALAVVPAPGGERP